MTKKILILFLFISISINNFAIAQSTTDTPVLSVSGNGEIKAKPDVAILNVSVVSRGKTAAEATVTNAAAAQKLINALEAQSIAEADIQTSNISISPVYKPNQSGSFAGDLQILAYEANNQLIVKVRNISNVGHIIDVISLTGNHTVQSINFDLDNSDIAEGQSLQAAVADAKRKANIVATAAGKSVSGIKSISVGSAVAFSESKFAPTAAGADFTTPVFPGELTVNSNVFIEYFLDGR